MEDGEGRNMMKDPPKLLNLNPENPSYLRVGIHKTS
jgi:hypothetical protein